MDSLCAETDISVIFVQFSHFSHFIQALPTHHKYRRINRLTQIQRKVDLMRYHDFIDQLIHTYIILHEFKSCLHFSLPPPNINLSRWITTLGHIKRATRIFELTIQTIIVCLYAHARLLGLLSAVCFAIEVIVTTESGINILTQHAEIVFTALRKAFMANLVFLPRECKAVGASLGFKC